MSKCPKCETDMSSLEFRCAKCGYSLDKKKVIEIDIACSSCGKVKETIKYNGKPYCNECVNAEEHGEKSNN